MLQHLSFFTFLLLGNFAFAQPRLIQRLAPPNDLCKNAISLELNHWLENQTNESCQITPSETPIGLPYTCIKSFENDLWYTITAAESTPLELYISTQACMTPAGLQCLVIQTDDCLASGFQYVACANKENLDTVKCYFDAQKGKTYHIYVDGFDGNVCDFSLGVFQRKNQVLVKEDCIYRRVTMGLNPLPTLDISLIARMRNNYPTIHFQDPQLQEALYYQIQRWNGYYWYTVGCLDPSVLTFGSIPEVTFIDYVTQDLSQPLAYRVVKASANNQRTAYSFTLKPILMKFLEVSEPKKTAEKNIFSYHFNNKKKQNLQIEITNNQKQVIKSKILKNQEVGLQENTIDLRTQSKGIYLLKFCNSEGCFEYEMEVL